VLAVLLVVGAALAGPAAPAPDAPLPTTAAALARELQRSDDGLRGAIDHWQGADRALAAAEPPRPVQLWALRQQRVLLLLRDRPGRAHRVLARLHRALARSTRETLAAMADLRRLAPVHPPRRRWKVGPALPAGRLLAIYREAARRFGIAWNVLAAVNFVETGFNKLRNESTAGAVGPMQFLPATWRSYGLGGNIHDPHDAIVAAANYLRAAGAPMSYRRALFHYNPSSLYVDAVLRYARRMGRSRRAFLSFYAWQVFVREPSGRLRRLTGPR
jgi:membrane-bound lytic murein transglycosylase B